MSTKFYKKNTNYNLGIWSYTISIDENKHIYRNFITLTFGLNILIKFWGDVCSIHCINHSPNFMKKLIYLSQEIDDHYCS